MLNLKFKDEKFLPHSGIDLEFQIQDGEILVLSGENGIGKTTIARKISLLVSNLVFVEQSSLDHFYQRKVGSLKKILEDSRKSEIEKEWLQELWTGFGLHEKEDREIDKVSGGESQGIKLALTLCRDTELYLLDEPFQYLDQVKKDFLYGFIQKLQALKKKILVIEHNFDPQFKNATFLKIEHRDQKVVKGKSWST